MRDTNLAGDQTSSGTHVVDVPGIPLAPDETRTAAVGQRPRVGGNPLAGDQCRIDTQGAVVACNTCDLKLLLYSAALDEVEHARMAASNRLWATMERKVPIDGYTEEAEAMLAELTALEHRAELTLKRAIREHPLGPWIKRTLGVGEKQAARLLAAIGDPATRDSPAQLWAYCGLAPGQQRRKGVKSNWNATAKTRAILIATSCIKHARSPYRPVYDRARENWADRDTSDLHKHQHALRLVAKAILKDMWIVSRSVTDSPG